MDRRHFLKSILVLGAGMAVSPLLPSCVGGTYAANEVSELPSMRFDVIVAGGGTAGVLAAIAAARTGAKTALIEWKGYTGGIITEGGTALHSFFNIWKPYPGVAKKQLVKGIPQEIIDRLIKVGGCAGHVEMETSYDYDSVCTAIDTEMYKLVTMQMIREAGVYMALNTMLCGAVMAGERIEGVIVESRAGREVLYAKSFVDSTGYGDLCAYAGARFTVPNDYKVANSMGIANVDMNRYYDFLKDNNALGQIARGSYDGLDSQLVRLGTNNKNLPTEFVKGLKDLSVATITTTVHKDYLMFIKCGYDLPTSPLNRDEVSDAEVQIRINQQKAIELYRKYIPGFEKAFISRTNPSLCIRRARCIECDYDLSNEEITNAIHFDDEVFLYGFHDSAPKYSVKNGGAYGFPYRCSCVKNVDNLYAIGMMVTSEHSAHMSTRNTVSCMAQGQAFGTAAALCALKGIGSRELVYTDLREQLIAGGVYLE